MNHIDLSSNTTVTTHDATGLHLLLTLSGCDGDILNDVDTLIELSRLAATATGATILQICSQRFEPQGVTVFAVLAESHASLHSYPEAGRIFWDCFTCGKSCDPERSIEVLVEKLKPQSVERKIVVRGDSV